MDDATGLVAGLQLGAAPALCSSAGTPHAISVAADSYVSDVKVAVDPKTGLVGQMLFMVKSNSSLLPTNVVSCGKVAGAPVSILPKLSALSTLSATCAPAPGGGAGRRLAQVTSFIAPGSLRATATTLGAAGGSAAAGDGGSAPPPPPPVAVILLSNLAAGFAGITTAVNIPYGVTFTTPATGSYTLNSASLGLSLSLNAPSTACTVTIQTVANGLPSGAVTGSNSVIATVSNIATASVPFTGLAATLNPSTTYALVASCTISNRVVWDRAGSCSVTGVFTPVNVVRQPNAWNVASTFCQNPLSLELSS